MPLQYSAAKLSLIGRKNNPKRLLSTQKAYLATAKKKEPKESPTQPKLEVVDYNVQLDYQLGNGNVEAALETVLETQWSETTTLHRRYTANNPLSHRGPHAGSIGAELVLFHFKGLSAKAGAEIIKFRQNIPLLATTSQLYSIFSNAGPTFVDKLLELLVREGKLRKFVITNAAPVISHSLQRYLAGKITYGFENVEVVTRTSDFDKLMAAVDTPAMAKFRQFCQENPTVLFVGPLQFSELELSELLDRGFITMTSNHMNEIESHQYSIAYPGCGTFLGVINAGRAWLVKTLLKGKYKEGLEDQLWQKFEGQNLKGELKLSNFRKPFFGYDLNWLLADALGAGVVEVFNTPVGRGWRLTGKV